MPYVPWKRHIIHQIMASKNCPSTGILFDWELTSKYVLRINTMRGLLVINPIAQIIICIVYYIIRIIYQYGRVTQWTSSNLHYVNNPSFLVLKSNKIVTFKLYMESVNYINFCSSLSISAFYLAAIIVIVSKALVQNEQSN